MHYLLSNVTIRGQPEWNMIPPILLLSNTFLVCACVCCCCCCCYCYLFHLPQLSSRIYLQLSVVMIAGLPEQQMKPHVASGKVFQALRYTKKRKKFYLGSSLIDFLLLFETMPKEQIPYIFLMVLLDFYNLYEILYSVYPNGQSFYQCPLGYNSGYITSYYRILSCRQGSDLKAIFPF